MISWRNPDARHAAWDFSTYGAGHPRRDGRRPRASPAVSSRALSGICSGGVISAMVAAHLAYTGQQHRIAAFDAHGHRPGPGQAGPGQRRHQRAHRRLAAAASRARGYLDGRSLAEVFAWLRPNDLIWNYWVNNYLLGRKPPAFDILFWNADTTRMTAGLHRRLPAPSRHQRADQAGRCDHARLARRPRRGSTATPTSSRASPTTSARGRAAISQHPAARRGRAGSCCPPAATSPRSSTRRATEATVRSLTTIPPDPEPWSQREQTGRAPGGRTTPRWLAERCGEEKDAPSEPGGGGLVPARRRTRNLRR